LPQVGVAGSWSAGGEAAEPGGGEMLVVELPVLGLGVGVVEEFAVFGDE
jgi:hypothetical protein